jgi:hypothetical protein
VSISYERLIAWLAGPIAIVAGSVAVWLDNHFSLLGRAGLGSDQTAKAIVDGLTFAVGAGVTYLGQFKWMSNLTAWWNHAQTTAGSPAANPGSNMATEDTPQDVPEQPDEPEAPFVDEPGYDEPGPGVEPDQPIGDPVEGDEPDDRQ